METSLHTMSLHVWHTGSCSKLCKVLKRSILDIITRPESIHLLILTKLTSETLLARTRPSLASSSIFTFWWAHLYKAIWTFKSLSAITVPLKASASIITNNILAQLCLKPVNLACHVCFGSLTWHKFIFCLCPCIACLCFLVWALTAFPFACVFNFLSYSKLLLCTTTLWTSWPLTIIRPSAINSWNIALQNCEEEI